MQNEGCGAEVDISVPLALLLPSTGAEGRQQEATAGEAGSWREKQLQGAQLWPQIFTDKCCWSNDGLGT